MTLADSHAIAGLVADGHDLPEGAAVIPPRPTHTHAVTSPK